MKDENDVANIIWNLRRQYHTGVSTWGTCCTKDCGLPARGSGLCKHCLTEELVEATGDRDAVKLLMQLLGHQHCCNQKVEDQIEELIG